MEKRIESARREWKRDPRDPVETNRRLIEEWLDRPKDFLAESWIPIHSVFRIALDATGGCAVYSLEGRRLNELLEEGDDREPHQYERKLFAEVVAVRLHRDGEKVLQRLFDLEEELRLVDKRERQAHRDDIIVELRHTTL